MTKVVGGVVIPGWFYRGIIAGGASLLITGATWLAVRANNHETRITVIEEHNKDIGKSLDELKAGQLEQSRDVKEILKRLPPVR